MLENDNFSNINDVFSIKCKGDVFYLENNS